MLGEPRATVSCTSKSGGQDRRDLRSDPQRAHKKLHPIPGLHRQTSPRTLSLGIKHQHVKYHSLHWANMRLKVPGTTAPLGVLALIAGLAVLTCFALPQNSARLLPGTLLQADQDRLLPNLAFYLPRADRQRRRHVRCSEGGYYYYYAFVAAARDSNHGRLKWGIDRNRCSATIPRHAGVLKVSPVPNGDSNGDAVVAEEPVDENKKSNKSIAFQDELQQLQQRHTMVFELQNNGEQNGKDLAVYGKLHRLLGRRRGLLGGASAVAIMTTLNFLVVHYGHDDSSSITGGSCSRLALGDPRWDVCGIDIDHGNTAMQV